jgi:K+-transporting ATPase KdpF subunit
LKENRYHAGLHFHSVTYRFLRACVVIHAGMCKALKRERPYMDYLIAGFISLALCMYLLYALLRPEKF